MLRRAIRLEWITIGVMLVSVAILFSVSGQSQAMKAAWIEDSLGLLPPLAFLVAIRFARKPTSSEFPYGHHRAVGVGHLVASVALLAMGTFLLVDSGIALLSGEKPPIGLAVIFGHEIWSGWLMIGALAITAIPAVMLGRLKAKPAAALHDKVLHADSDMNSADWRTALATIIGILGIGAGVWWADAAAAIVISVSVLKDGWTNLSGAISGLADARPTTFDNSEPHPLIGQVDEVLDDVDWVRDHGIRLRDEGHVFHIEAFLVPHEGEGLTLERLAEVRKKVSDVDWKVEDVVVTAVTEVRDIHRPL